MNRRYTNKDKARVRACLISNNGNIYRTSKDTNISRETITSWKREWEKEGLPKEIEVLAEQIVFDHITDAERVRNLAIKALENKVRMEEVTVKDLYMIFSILEDKITRARGMATTRTETIVALPDIRNLGDQLGSYIIEALDAVRARKQAIDGVVIEEPLALPTKTGEI